MPEPLRATSLFDVRRLSTSVVVGALLVSIAVSIVANFVWFRSDASADVVVATGGLLNGTLLANLFLIAVVVVGCLGWFGGARAADLGLRLRDLPAAVFVTVAVWLSLHAAAFAVEAFSGHSPATAEWTHSATGIRFQVGDVLAQVFGNALYEEILFRGCLLVWFFHRLTARDAAAQRPNVRTTWCALLLSQAVFALQHVPNRLAHDAWHGLGDVVTDLLLLFVSGLFFAGVFVRTGNLLIAVGIHALGNCPAMVWTTVPWLHPAVMFVATVALLAVGPRFFRDRGR